jgi:hypothetical protein
MFSKITSQFRTNFSVNLALQSWMWAFAV